MAKYKIGVTEAGDAGIDLTWEDKLDRVDGAILITKNITEEFCKAAIRHKDKVIVHATVTGYGGTVVEPNVPSWEDQVSALTRLIAAGFAIKQTVVRVDPIIPTIKGMARALRVMMRCIDLGFARYRISIIDIYPHVCERFLNAGLPVPYNGRFSPNVIETERINGAIRTARFYWKQDIANRNQDKDLRIEACAEPGLTEAVQCGCVSAYDLSLLGLDADDADTTGYQRRNCLCYSGKVELLNRKTQCPHKCLYCYWR